MPRIDVVLLLLPFTAAKGIGSSVGLAPLHVSAFEREEAEADGWLEVEAVNVALGGEVGHSKLVHATHNIFSVADKSGRGKRCSCLSGGGIFQSPMYSFLGCEKAKTLSKTFYIMVN